MERSVGGNATAAAAGGCPAVGVAGELEAVHEVVGEVVVGHLRQRRRVLLLVV
jgi:hypothetical protein